MKDDSLLTEREAAQVLRCSPSTLRDWRHQQKGPQFTRIGPKMIRYRLDALRQFTALKGGQFSLCNLAEAFDIYPYLEAEFTGDWQVSDHGKNVFSRTAQSDECNAWWGDPDDFAPIDHELTFTKGTVLWTVEGFRSGVLFVPRQGRAPSGPLPPVPKPSTDAIQPTQELYG